MGSENPRWERKYNVLKNQQNELDGNIKKANDRLKELEEEKLKSKKEDYKKLDSLARDKKEEITELLDELFPIQNILKKNGEKIDNLIVFRSNLQERKDQKQNDLINEEKKKENLQKQITEKQAKLEEHSKQISILEGRILVSKYREKRCFVITNRFNKRKR